MDASVATSSAADTTPDLWNLYPDIDRDVILQAIWIDGALKDTKREWVPRPIAGFVPISMTDGTSARAIASFLSRYYVLLQKVYGRPRHLLLSIRRDAKETGLYYQWTGDGTVPRSVAATTSETIATVDVETSAIATATDATVESSSVPPDIACAVDAPFSADIAEVVAAIKTLLVGVPHEWVSDSGIDAERAYMTWAPTGPDAVAARRAAAESICNHVYAVVGASRGQPHCVAICASNVSGGKRIEFLYDVSPIASGTVVAPSEVTSVGPVPTASVIPTDAPVLADASVEGQTVAEIVALYPRLSSRQVASLLMVESGIERLPHYWTETPVVGRTIVKRALVSDTDEMIKDIRHLCEMHARGQRVALCVHRSPSSSAMLSAIVPRPLSSPKTQTADDLLELYPTVTAREVLVLVKVVEGLKGIPTEWVDGDSGHTYDNNGLFADASEMIGRVRGAFAKINTESAPCHVVLSLHRDASAPDKLVYYFIVVSTV